MLEPGNDVGDYKLIEEVAEHRQPGHVTQVWQARKSGGRADQVYAIKVFIPQRPPHPVERSGEELGEDPISGFIEGVKRLKQAHAAGGACLIPVHDFGMTDGGAWFATDYAPCGSIKKLIERAYRPDSEDLRHVISSVVNGCLALKRITARSHGSLRPSNILLTGASLRPLRKTPLQLMDPYPASLSVVNRLSPSDRETVAAMLAEALELHDLRCIGELIFQMVEQRLIHGYDYNLPTTTSPTWTGLGKDGEFWRQLCLKLLDPNLTLDTLSLESLAAQFPPRKASKLPLIVAAIAAIVLIAGGGFMGVKSVLGKIQKAKTESRQLAEQEYRVAMETGRTAYSKGQWREAVDKADEALKLKPNDAAAGTLKADAQGKLKDSQTLAANEKKYLDAMETGRTAYSRGQWQETVDKADEALKYKPGDAAANKLKADAQARLGAEQNYAAALKAGQEAFAAQQWTVAVTKADEALKHKPGDAAANKLKADAQARLGAEQNYAAALKAGQEAFAAQQWTVAVTKADEALKHKPGDAAANKLKADAQARLGAEQNYAAALKAGQEAFAAQQWTVAVTKADEALKHKPGDAAANKLKADAQARLGAEQNYAAALKAGQEAFAAQQWTVAVTKADEALKHKPGDAAANKLKADAQARLGAEQNYAAALKAGQEAFAAQQWTVAVTKADEALKHKPGDAAANKLKADAQARLGAEQNYAAALKAGQEAFAAQQWTVAVTKADEALKYKPGDAAAGKLKSDAQGKLKDAELLAANEKKYQDAMEAGMTAYSRGQWQETVDKADEALKLKPNDAAAGKLKSDAQGKLKDAELLAANEKKYQDAMETGRTAYSRGQWQETVDKADEALKLKPNDAAANKLKLDARGKIEEAASLTEARNDFTQGLYGQALAICARYAGVSAFEQLKVQAMEEQRVLQGFQERLDKADYAWTNELAGLGYGRKDPYQKLGKEAVAEAGQLSALEECRRQTNWSELLKKAGSLSQQAASKAPFVQLVTWAKEEDAKYQSGIAQRLETADNKLRTLCNQFNVKIPKGLQRREWKTVPRMTQLGSGGEDNPNKRQFFNDLKSLRREYENLNNLKLDDREVTLDKLYKSVELWP